MITTHVLDTSLGRPAAGVPLNLESQGPDGSWKSLAHGVTDADGRARGLTPTPPPAGRYRLTFDVADYFRASGRETFFPEASLVFEIKDAGQHYHVPLLVSGYGYSTYRGS